MTWVNELPAKLQSAAYQAGDEHAWGRDDALEVLSWLEQRGFAVLGVDIWLPTTPGPTIPSPYVYDWDIEISPKIPGAAQNALEFTRLFQWHIDDEYYRETLPYFAIGPVELRI